jgi:hypothetical protein
MWQREKRLHPAFGGQFGLPLRYRSLPRYLFRSTSLADGFPPWDSGERTCGVVYRYDRFARSLRQLVNALCSFDALGIQFVSLHEGVDT